MELPRRYADAIIQHALEESPNECCGILAAQGERFVKHYRMTNMERSPYRYSMDGKELLAAYHEIEDSGWELRVIYHSHTHSPAYPSATDVRLATWPEARYVLVSLQDPARPDIRAFTIADEQVAEEPVAIVDEPA
ncbi:MAG: M67 family metallopeptidase [Chloroflexota bacterium]|nr:M67 family metallopeptidase [Chloroflexota bacterium]